MGIVVGGGEVRLFKARREKHVAIVPRLDEAEPSFSFAEKAMKVVAAFTCTVCKIIVMKKVETADDVSGMCFCERLQWLANRSKYRSRESGRNEEHERTQSLWAVSAQHRGLGDPRQEIIKRCFERVTLRC